MLQHFEAEGWRLLPFIDATKLVPTSLAQNPHPAAVSWIIDEGDLHKWCNWQQNLAASSLPKALRIWRDLPTTHECLRRDIFANTHVAAMSLVLDLMDDIDNAYISNNDDDDFVAQLLRMCPNAFHAVFELCRRNNDRCIGLLREWLSEGRCEIDWSALSRNPHPWAIKQLRANPDKIDLQSLTINSHPWAVARVQTDTYGNCGFFDDMEEQPDGAALLAHMVAGTFSDDGEDFIQQLWYLAAANNPDAIAYVRQHKSTIMADNDYFAVLYNLGHNPRADALQLLRDILAETTPDIVEESIGNGELASTPHPMALEMWYKFVGEHSDCYRINYANISANPAIFVDALAERTRLWFRDHVTEELIAYVWHPRNIARFSALGEGIDVDEVGGDE